MVQTPGVSDADLTAEALDELIRAARLKVQETMLLLDQIIVKATLLNRISRVGGPTDE